jgi:hypothetical protein
MPSLLFNKIIKSYLTLKYKKFKANEDIYEKLQQKQLHNFLSEASETLYGSKYEFKKIKNYSDFKHRVPLVKYDDLYPFIHKMMMGESNVLWPGKTNYFSKSSGTTSNRSKYIPITNTFLRKNLIRSSWDTTSVIYHNDPEAQIFYHKSLIMGGTLAPYENNSNVIVGDVSAIMINTIPPIGRPFYTPDFETASLKNWDEKINAIVEKCMYEKVTMFGGVPTWNIVLFNKLLEVSGKSHILEVWPELKYYLHGGVNFEPYREVFKKFLPKENFYFLEVYNASEGYFAIQDRMDQSGMKIMVDNGIFYEFIEPEYLSLPDAHQMTLDLSQVKPNVNYAIVITTNSGLWRYIVGDTVKFQSTAPHRISVTGRIEQYINAFGEEVMIENVEKALALTSHQFQVSIREYTVAPFYLSHGVRGYHEWLIEFIKTPDNLVEFELALDNNLRKINSDYDAKRYQDLALENLKIIKASDGLFYKWLSHKNKVGGQFKVPRLANDRRYLDEILASQIFSNQ